MNSFRMHPGAPRHYLFCCRAAFELASSEDAMKPLLSALLLLPFAAFLVSAAQPASEALIVKAPTAAIALQFKLDAGQPVYSVSFRGKQIVRDSHLGLVFTNAPQMSAFIVANQKTTDHDSTWKPVYGERSV